jgi:hypothetical protein
MEHKLAVGALGRERELGKLRNKHHERRIRQLGRQDRHQSARVRWQRERQQLSVENSASLPKRHKSEASDKTQTRHQPQKSEKWKPNRELEQAPVAAYRIIGEVELGQHHERVDVIRNRRKHELS